MSQDARCQCDVQVPLARWMLRLPWTVSDTQRRSTAVKSEARGTQLQIRVGPGLPVGALSVRGYLVPDFESGQLPITIELRSLGATRSVHLLARRPKHRYEAGVVTPKVHNSLEIPDRIGRGTVRER